MRFDALVTSGVVVLECVQIVFEANIFWWELSVPFAFAIVNPEQAFRIGEMLLVEHRNVMVLSRIVQSGSLFSEFLLHLRPLVDASNGVGR